MRKNWTKNEDLILTKIVGELGLNDWTAVATCLKLQEHHTQRTGKQCRERWYNHLDPAVNKEVWSYEEELRLFEVHRELGNRWKEISMQLKGRTDNNIKNHFYSTLRRSLRRLNKVIGEKNSTLQMREIKPSVLTIILNFIYDHQEESPDSNQGFLKELKDLPKLIFEFAEFKPVKGNMENSMKEANRSKISSIFRLIETFKESYYNEKQEKKKVHFDFELSSLDDPPSPLARQVITSQFRPMEKPVNVIINNYKEDESSLFNHNRGESGEKEKSAGRDRLICDGESHRLIFDGESQFNLGEVEEPSPLTYIQENNPYPQLVVIGKHWSPRVEDSRPHEIDIDEILEMNYD